MSIFFVMCSVSSFRCNSPTSVVKHCRIQVTDSERLACTKYSQRSVLALARACRHAHTGSKSLISTLFTIIRFVSSVLVFSSQWEVAAYGHRHCVRDGASHSTASTRGSRKEPWQIHTRTQAQLYRPNDYNNSMHRPKSTDIIITGSHTPPPRSAHTLWL